MIYPAIRRIAARTSLGDWPTTWTGLLAARSVWTSTSVLAGLDIVELNVGAIANLNRELFGTGEGPALRLARSVLNDVEPDGDTPLYVGSNHSEAELVRTLLGEPTPGQGVAMLDDRITPAQSVRPLRSYAACAAGLHALIAAAHDLVESDAPRRALVLAVDALSVIETMGFTRAGALSAQGARPFSVERDGLTIGEGAVLVELDRFPEAHHVRILGIGMSCDAFHPTDPDPSGQPLQRAIRMAMTDAGLDSTKIAAIVAHGTGTPKGDEAETAALIAIWGLRPPPVTSVKGSVGHLMGAAGLLNLAVACEISRTGLAPPTCEIADHQHLGDWVVTGSSRAVPCGAPVICLASGFGGNNVAIVVGKS